MAPNRSDRTLNTEFLDRSFVSNESSPSPSTIGRTFYFRSNSKNSDLRSYGSDSDLVGCHIEERTDVTTQCDLDSEEEVREYFEDDQIRVFSNFHSLPDLSEHRNLRCSTKSTQTSCDGDPIFDEACRLAKCVVDHILGISKNTMWKKIFETTTENVLCNLVDQLLHKHEIYINSLIRQLKVDNYHTFSLIADEVLRGEPTWSRIITLYAYGGSVAAQHYRLGHREISENITRFLGQYIGNQVGMWIKQQGGWISIVEWQSQGNSMNSFIMKTLCATLLSLGLLSAFAFFKR